MHPTLTRAKSAVDLLENKDVRSAAANMIAAIESNIVAGSQGVPYDAIAKVKEAFGISDQYILFGEGEPITRTVSAVPATYASAPVDVDTRYDCFRARLAMVLNHAGMPIPDIAKALEVSRQSPHTWRTTGQISKDNLRKLCAIEGVDYGWVVEGRLDSEEATKSVTALYQRARTNINASIDNLNAELERCKALCGSAAN